MRFTVPQFIEHEAKIVGPLTFRQFTFVGIAGAFGFVLYFNAPFLVFLVSVIFMLVISLALAFVKIGGRDLFTILFNLLKFSIAPKMYIWRKKSQAEIEIKIKKK